MPFDTEVTLTGPWRTPVQLLAEQEYDGHASVHDDATASSLGLKGAPIEGPTHFSQFDPLAATRWGNDWFRRGCISAHFQTMVVEGEEVQATLVASAGASATSTSSGLAAIGAHKRDGTPVLTGTASLSAGDSDGTTEVGRRLAKAIASTADELFIIDQLEIGATYREPRPVRIRRHEHNGPTYPFSLEEKLAAITEPHPWYTDDAGRHSPWGRAIVPMELVSVLAHQHGLRWPVRTPSIALFLDLEVRLLEGPLFVEQDYVLEHELVALGASRRTESYWTRTSILDDIGAIRAKVLLHMGVFKDSYPGYPG